MIKYKYNEQINILILVQECMLGKPKKNSNIRIVVLKQTPLKKPLYQSFEINHELCQRISSDLTSQKYRKYTDSVAFLSSILQDQNLAQEERYDSNYQSRQSTNTYEASKRSDHELQWPKLIIQSNKPKDRQLSCIIQSSEPQKSQYDRFKTESIQKIIAEKKMMPIDRLKIGRKNISFSSKNKEELKKDFDQFVNIAKLETNNPHAKNNQHIRSIIMGRREGETNAKMKWRKRLKTEFKQQETNQPSENYFHKGYKKGKEEMSNVFARYCKKVRTNMEEMENFKWSKVDEYSYCLSK